MSVEQEVKVVESCMVTPSEETPRKGLWISPIDLTWATRGHTPTVHLYRPGSGSGSGASDGFFDVARLKAALAKALVPFYPLAGRLGMDSNGRAHIDCTGEGALFVVAHSDLSFEDVSKLKPSRELKRLFIPRVEDYSPPLMCGLQVNFLKGGGVAVGMTLHHTSADAMSAFHFFKTWSAFSRDEAAAAAALELPCHERTLLRPRSPPVVHPDALTVFCPRLAGQPEPPPGAVENVVFVVSKEQINAIKKRACTAGGGGGGVSTFCAVSAHLWRCLCVARRLPPDATTRLTFPANVRHSLRPPLPDTYFGNGIVMLGAAAKVQDIVGTEDGEELASVAGRIRDVIRRMDDELVRSVIDHLEMAGSQTFMPSGSMPLTELKVVSWRGMPVCDADFGWGKPVAMHRAVQPNGGIICLIDDDGGGIRVVLSAEPGIVKDFERLLLGAKF